MSSAAEQASVTGCHRPRRAPTSAMPRAASNRIVAGAARRPASLAVQIGGAVRVGRVAGYLPGVLSRPAGDGEASAIGSGRQPPCRQGHRPLRGIAVSRSSAAPRSVMMFPKLASSSCACGWSGRVIETALVRSRTASSRPVPPVSPCPQGERVREIGPPACGIRMAWGRRSRGRARSQVLDRGVENRRVPTLEVRFSRWRSSGGESRNASPAYRNEAGRSAISPVNRRRTAAPDSRLRGCGRTVRDPSVAPDVVRR